MNPATPPPCHLLPRAAELGKVHWVAILLRRGCNPNLRDAAGNLPLHLAHQTGLRDDGAGIDHLEVAWQLLRHGADPWAVDRQGNHPLHQAALHGQWQLVRHYLQCGIPVEIRDPVGNTPLLLAARKGGVTARRTVRLLLAWGAEINAVNHDGENALIVPSLWGQLRMVKLLLKNGIAPDRADNWMTTPLGWAARGGYYHTVYCLLRHGATPGTAGVAATPEQVKRNRHGIARRLLAANRTRNFTLAEFHRWRGSSPSTRP